MDTPRIILQGFLQLFQAPGQTLRIFALPILLGFVALALHMVLTFPGRNPAANLIGAVIQIPALLVLAAWPAVNFHRHILAGEHFSMVPALHLRQILTYILALIVILVPAYITASALEMIRVRFLFELMSIPGGLDVSSAVIDFVFTAILLFGCAALPSIVTGRAFVRQLRDTRRALPAIVLIALLATAFSVGADAALRQASLSMEAASLVTQWWPLTMIGELFYSVLVVVFAISLFAAIFQHVNNRTDRQP